ncbi:hypothetical protein TSUD_284100 [Trifolium subterraneum]|uniref:Uncharacterized protein n=1 Tax=Trifolium subterraneum TaxID=3900 RepID=A0A2Z6NZC5_TRISU|nr:hypothetical protein TSUD_284100 [Trifolium subterraneum]
MVLSFTKGKNENLKNTSANSISDSFSMFTMLFSNDCKISDDRFNITIEGCEFLNLGSSSRCFNKALNRPTSIEGGGFCPISLLMLW